MSPTIAVIVKGYPRLSETFIAQEIEALENRGLSLQIISLRHPTDPDVHPVHGRIAAPVNYLPEYLYQEPVRVLRAIFRIWRYPGVKKMLQTVWQDLKRDFSPNRIRRFGQALVLAAELDSNTTLLYAHFLHTPASVARYTSLLLQRPWSCSAHAKDVWTQAKWEIKEKLDDCAWLVTCTEANWRYLSKIATRSDTVELLYHGLDFSNIPSAPSIRTTSGNADEVVVLSVGRAVEKKGYTDLLDALALIPDGIKWKFIHIGGGPLLAQLKQQMEELKLTKRITWRGALSQTEVFNAYQNADIFVLPSRIAEDGDRDGLPNVLMEAQSQGLACIATNISGIPELIDNEESGLLVPQRDCRALANALCRLMQDDGLRQSLAQAGLYRVRNDFSAHHGIDQLIARIVTTNGLEGIKDGLTAQSAR